MPANWPQLILEGGFVTTAPVQPAGTFILDDGVNGQLDTNTLGGDVTWSDLSVWMRSGSVTRPATRQQGPLWAYQQGSASVVLKNEDGRFDPDNLSGPYVSAGMTELNAMVPVRIRAMWDGITYGLFWGFADGWDDDGANYAGRYAETALTASDGQKVLNGITLPAAGAVGAGEATGARITRILDAAMWFTGPGYRTVATGDSTVQAYAGGDTAWNLMQVTADSEIGELYVSGSGQVVFRNRGAILTDTRSSTPQAVFGDAPGTADAAGTEVPYYQAPRARDDTTLANDIQATRVGGTLQEVQDATSIATYLFPRSYQRTDLILQNDSDALNWAQWVLYVSKSNEDRFDQLVIYPLRDPQNLWPQALGREIGDRIQIWRRPPGVASPVTKDVFIRGIAHAWDWSAGTWQTTFTLQDASKYGSFLVLDNATLGQLDSNSLAFLRIGTMATHTFNVGDVLTAALVNSWLEPLAAVKPSNQSVTSSTAVVNDNDLSFAAAANVTYLVQMVVLYDGGTNGSSDLKYLFTVPAGATFNGVVSYIPAGSVNGNVRGFDLTAAQSAATNGAGVLEGLSLIGTVVMSSTAGTVQFKWAQNTSSGTATIVHAGSALAAQRIA